jgi:nickel-dependent lactate racemase
MMTPTRPPIAPASSQAVALRAGPVVAGAPVPAGWSLDALPAFAAARPLDEAGIARALEEAGLPAAAHGARRVSILVPDSTRVARTDLLVGALLGLLVRAGVPAAGIEVVVATGSHPSLDDTELRRLAGRAEVRLRQHDCRAAGLARAGVTRSGSEVGLDPGVLDADLVVATGRVTNHYFAGYTGGAKALLPGVAAYQAIARNHRLVLDPEGWPDPRAANGRLRGNPVREEMEEVAAMLPRPPFLANTLVDDAGAIAALCAGSLGEAFPGACAAAEAACAVEVARPYDVVVVGSGGAPGDGSLMQALKAPLDWAPALRPGGVLVWVAGCGRARLPGFQRWLSLATPELREQAVAAYDLFAHNSLLLRAVAERCTLLLASPLPAEEVRSLGLHPAPDLQAALDRARDLVGPRARCLTVDAGNVTWARAGEGRA